jgi:hypothetical protein
LPRPAWTMTLLFMLPEVAGMTGISHHVQLICEIGSYELFCIGWPQTMILQISSSWVAMIRGMSCCALPLETLDSDNDNYGKWLIVEWVQHRAIKQMWDNYLEREVAEKKSTFRQQIFIDYQLCMTLLWVEKDKVPVQ